MVRRTCDAWQLAAARRSGRLFFDQIFIEQSDDEKSFRLVSIDMTDGVLYRHKHGQWRTVGEVSSLERSMLYTTGQPVFPRLSRRDVDNLVRIQRESKTISSVRELP